MQQEIEEQVARFKRWQKEDEERHKPKVPLTDLEKLALKSSSGCREEVELSEIFEGGEYQDLVCNLLKDHDGLHVMVQSSTEELEEEDFIEEGKFHIHEVSITTTTVWKKEKK